MKNEKYTLQMTAHQIQVVTSVLGEAPYKIAAPLIASLQSQIYAADNAEAQRQKEEAAKAEYAEGAEASLPGGGLGG